MHISSQTVPADGKETPPLNRGVRHTIDLVLKFAGWHKKRRKYENTLNGGHTSFIANTNFDADIC